jgi:hypothetical protein
MYPFAGGSSRRGGFAAGRLFRAEINGIEFHHRFWACLKDKTLRKCVKFFLRLENRQDAKTPRLGRSQ